VKSTNISVNEAIFELAINSRMAFFFNLWNRDVKICVMDDITKGNTTAWKLIPSFRTLLAAKGPDFRFQNCCCAYKRGSDVAHRSDFLMGRCSNPWQASYRKIKFLGRMKTNTWN
jgi:hypothetical protein